MPVVWRDFISANFGFQVPRYELKLSSNHPMTALPRRPLYDNRKGTPDPRFLAGTPRESGM